MDVLRRKEDLIMRLGQMISIKKGTFLWKNYTEDVHQKQFPHSFLILVNTPKTANV